MTSFCKFLITSFYLYSSLLAQSVPSNDRRQLNASQFSGSAYLSTILQYIVNSGSIMIVTDCLIERDIRLASNFSISVSIFNQSDPINAKLFGENKEIFVIDLPEMEVENATKIIYETFLKERVSKWQPTIIIFWRGFISRIQQATLLRRHFPNLMLHLDCNIFVIFFEASFPFMSTTPTSIAMWEMYAIKTKPVLSLVGHLSIVDQLIIVSLEHKISLESFTKRRSNFQLEKFTAAVKNDQDIKDWTGLETNEDDDGTYLLSMTDNLVAVIYLDLKMLMNFSAKVIAGDTIYIHRNGTASGKTARLLNSGEADISLNHASFSPGRANSFSFLQPTYHSLIHVFFKQPPANSIRDIVIAAFKKELWITLIGVWAILLMSLQVRLLLLPKNCSSTPSSPEPSTASTDYRFAKESVLWSVAIVCQKSWYLSPRSTTLRMKVILGSIVSLISYTAYSASIVSSLAVNKIPVKTFTDLISFDFIFTVHEKSEPFQAILRGLLQSFDLSQEVVTTSTVTEISHLIADSSSNVHTSRNAFLSSADMFYRTAETLNYSDIFICKHISSIPAGPTLHKSGTLVTKGSHYKEVLNHMLIYLKERGMLLRYIDRYNSKYVLYCVNRDFESRVEPAVLNDVFTIILVLFVGIPLALVVLATEIMYSACISKRYT